jgi:hypothetical protein
MPIAGMPARASRASAVAPPAPVPITQTRVRSTVPSGMVPAGTTPPWSPFQVARGMGGAGCTGTSFRPSQGPSYPTSAHASSRP